MNLFRFVAPDFKSCIAHIFAITFDGKALSKPVLQASLPVTGKFARLPPREAVSKVSTAPY